MNKKKVSKGPGIVAVHYPGHLGASPHTLLPGGRAILWDRPIRLLELKYALQLIRDSGFKLALPGDQIPVELQKSRGRVYELAEVEDGPLRELVVIDNSPQALIFLRRQAEPDSEAGSAPPPGETPPPAPPVPPGETPVKSRPIRQLRGEPAKQGGNP